MASITPSSLNSEPEDYYFANAPLDKIGDCLMDRVENYYIFLNATGVMNLWRRSFAFFYNSARLGGRVNPVGKKLELQSISMDDYPNLLRNILVLTTAQMPSMQTMCSNGDEKTLEQNKISQQVLDYETRVHRVNDYIVQSGEDALWGGEGFIYKGWNPNLGEETAPDANPDTMEPIMDESGQQKVLHVGDWEFENLTNLDVVRDVDQLSYDACQWVIVRRFRNKWDLIAQYPQFKDEIQRASWALTDRRNSKFGYSAANHRDLIPTFEFFHDKTLAVPMGRQTLFLDSDTVLFDGPLAYGSRPVYRCPYAELRNNPFGWTVGFSLLPLAEANNRLTSTLLTNVATFGVTRVLNPRGANISLQALSENLAIIDYTPTGPTGGKPEVLNMANPITKETGDLLKFINSKMETYAGINSTLRGQIEHDEMSGAAMAMQASISLQYSAGFQKSIIKMLEDVGTGMVQDLKAFASAPRQALIVGKNDVGYMQSYSQKDFDGIDRVVVAAANPLLNTTAGKINLADQLLQNGMLPQGESGAMKYIQVMNTGKLEPETQALTSEYMAIQTDKEMLLQGKMPMIQMTDNHPLRMQEVNVLNNNPIIRGNPQLGQLVRQYLMGHFQQWLQMPPLLAAAMGIQPPPPQGGPGGPPPPQQPHAPGPIHPQPPQPQTPHPQNKPPMMGTNNPIAQNGAKVKGPGMPQMPKNAPAGNKQAIQQMPPPNLPPR
jgi:hypothetical protein